MSRKILVLGATGAMRQYLIPYLAEAGYSVDAVSLDAVTSSWPHVNYIQANAKDKTVMKQLLAGNYDGIVDLNRESDKSHLYKNVLQSWNGMQVVSPFIVVNGI